MEDTRYNVPLLHGDQSRASMAVQCVNLIQHLESVMDEVFGTILNRINDNALILQDLNQRATLVQAKVEQLKGRTNATQVFSSAVYPGREKFTPFKHLLSDEPKKHFQSVMIEKGDTFEPTEYNPSLIKDKLDFFHVHNHRSHSIAKDLSKKEGLGRLPPHISSVSSLLLYNTTHNPYKKYMILDPLGVVSGTRGESKPDNDNLSLHDAPISIKEGDQVVQAPKDEFQYLPDLSDLPELDLPMELPSLPGIANDLSYEADDEAPSIAPSLGLPDLPLFESLSPTSQSPQPPCPPPPVPVTHPSPPSVSVAVDSSLPSVPPPPPLPPQQLVQPPPFEIPPPPPPPPPLPAPVSPPVQHGEDSTPVTTKQVVAAPSSGSSRQDLMRAIQDAGGAGKAKLRKVSSKKTDTDEGKESANASAAPSSGGDLMSDLMSKLSQRRKGISGSGSQAKKETNLGPSLRGESPVAQTTMEKVSSIIPPPPTRHESDSDCKHSDSEDWD